MDYHIIRGTAVECLLECGVSTFPIDCFAILRYYQFKLYTYEQLSQLSPELFHMCRSYSDDAFVYNGIVAYNEKKIMPRIRFSLMHELGHHLLGHLGSCPQNEQEADFFASNILAPRIIIHQRFYRSASQIHKAFGLSITASNRVLADYKLWFEQICHTTKKPSLSEQHLESLFCSGKSAVIAEHKKSPDKPTRVHQDLKDRHDFFNAWHSENGSQRMYKHAERQNLFGQNL